MINAQKVVSIGFHSSFSEDHDVLVRESMSHAHALSLVKQFLYRMEKLQKKHYAMLPKSVKDALKDFKVKLGDKTLPVLEKAQIAQKFRYLENLSKLKVIGI